MYLYVYLFNCLFVYFDFGCSILIRNPRASEMHKIQGFYNIRDPKTTQRTF